jgi:manganese transport protein
MTRLAALRARFKGTRKPDFRASELFRFLGPGVLVTVGFIDPGNWAANLAAGSGFGYALLWMMPLSTLMLIVLQHNAAHLGIATGLCLSEAATKHLPRPFSRALLGSAVLAAIATAFAEILGGAIALEMLLGLPLDVGAVLVAALVAALLLTNSYRRLEKLIIGFVSLIGLSFLFELGLVHVDFGAAARGSVLPSFPPGSMLVVMSVLGAVVMPHNLFLHSEVIQSRHWNLADDGVRRRQLRYELLDTLLSMGVGWAINSAIIVVAAATFFSAGHPVDTLADAGAMLRPLLGGGASIAFALALLFAGIASSVTAGMAGGSIVAGVFGEHYDVGDWHSRLGVGATIGGALLAIFFVRDPFRALVYSQMALSVQLPWTICAQIALTSSRKVMGAYANSRVDNALLGIVALAVAALNVALLASLV